MKPVRSTIVSVKTIKYRPKLLRLDGKHCYSEKRKPQKTLLWRFTLLLQKLFDKNSNIVAVIENLKGCYLLKHLV